MKLTYFIFFISAYAFFAKNITLVGTVFNQTNKLPIPYVNITILNSQMGSISNSDGRFKLNVKKSIDKIKFSAIGFHDTVITFDRALSELKIFLSEKIYRMEEVVVSPHTWAEKFIIKAIKENEKQKLLLKYYKAQSYSKTSFFTDSLKLIGIIEAISEISFLEPNKFKEKLLSLELQPHFKNIPYEAIAVNQSINLLNDRSDLFHFSIINPLIPDALEYYTYSLDKMMIGNNDTLVYINIEPTNHDDPLFKGELVFSFKTKNLIEANLEGNERTFNNYFDSVRVHQQFSNNVQEFNMPKYTSASVKQNVMGFDIKIRQEFIFSNYEINNPKDIPYISSNNIIEKNLNTDYDLEFKRDNIFNLPLSRKEKDHKKRIKKIFEDGSILKKTILFAFVDLFPLMFDQPSQLFGMKIPNFSNFYRFNKIDGHYLGYERNLINSNNYSLFATIGYGFSSHEFYFSSLFRYRNFDLSVNKKSNYLGEFYSAKTIQSISTLFTHKDDYNYYHSFQVKSKLSLQLDSKTEVVLCANLEKEKSTENNTEFSFFNRDKNFTNNIKVKDYWNNYFSVLLDYKTNYNYLENRVIPLKGKSFLNFVAEGRIWDKLFNSTEDLFSLDLKMQSYIEIKSPIRIELNLNYFNIANSEFIQRYRFTSENDSFQEKENLLTFASIGNYYFTLNEYLYFDTYLNLYDLPRFLSLRMSIGLFLTGVKSFGNPSFSVINTLSEDTFYEYGIALKGISILNFYLGVNSIQKDKFFLNVGIGL